MDEQKPTGMTAKSVLLRLALLLIVTVALAKLFGHGFADWRLILSMFLFGSVTFMMGWNQKMGMIKAKRLSEEILAKHKAESDAGIVGARH